ncbi:MAG: COX15/CtaA family protein [Planctomycetaceae bacterium]|nr:COX15/CtaA family protein [Planctomycetaceae bacterium]
MSSDVSTVSPLLRKLATATCLVALLPIGMGALVTTLKAGMAFADWPSSDGHNMLLYPWFRDFATNTDKFVEHGHRLAGMLIGCLSLVLTFVGLRSTQKWIRVFVVVILLSVIGQGLLGGARVLMNAQVLAMTHSLTGALFFTLCVIFRLLLSQNRNLQNTEQNLGLAGAAVTAILPVAVLAQYAIGGVLRHLHNLNSEHIAGAIVVSVLSVVAVSNLLFANLKSLRFAGLSVMICLLFQVCLGMGSWVLRFGWADMGYVATAGSLPQAVICSLHTVVGMFLFASAAVASLLVVQLHCRGQLACTSLSGFSTQVGGAT